MRMLQVILFMALALSASVQAQPGTLDASFGVGGMVTTAIVGDAQISGMVIQSDGKIVVSGFHSESVINPTRTTAFVMRYNPDGTLDNMFGSNGKIEISRMLITALAIQSDGKILIAVQAGAHLSASFTIRRFNADGTADAAFGDNGILSTLGNAITSITILPNESILVAGAIFRDDVLRFMMQRLTPQGFIDGSFGANGIVETEVENYNAYARDVAITHEGKIVLTGSVSLVGETFGLGNNVVTARYNADGSLDNSFGGMGMVRTMFGNANGDTPQAVALQADGKVVIAGWTHSAINSTSEMMVVRYNVDGLRDDSFGNTGLVTMSVQGVDGSAAADDILIQPDGKILVIGSFTTYTSTDLIVIRCNLDGSKDQGFGNAGIATTTLEDHEFGQRIALQPDGKIVAAGHARVAGVVLTRYYSGLNVGSVDWAGMRASATLYPQPVREQAVMEYDLPQADEVSLELYDAIGRKVATLLSHEARNAGRCREHIVLGAEIPSGNYSLELRGRSGRTIVTRLVRI